MGRQATGTLRGFDDHFDELWAVAYQVAFKILGDREDASDVAQDALVRTAIRWDRVNTYAAAFTAHVAGQRAIDIRRRQARRAALDPSRAPEPAQVEERDELIRALRRLPKRQRQVVVLRFLGDISEADTAKALGCSPGSVKTHSTRGLAALRASLTALPQGA